MRSELVRLRRDFHQHPELSFQETETAAKGRHWFAELGLEVREEIAGTHGVVATLDSGKPGPTLMIRGDMDALPIEEETATAYGSTRPGVMHACGHDVHTTCVLGAARLLTDHRESLRGRVQFLLQPGEESPPGGARILVDEGGILAGVDAALALHVYPNLPVGQLGFKPGHMLAHSARFKITIRGLGGHAAMPHLALDPIPVAAQLVQALQTLVSRETDPVDSVVVTVGSIHGGTAANVIAGSVEMTGTVRCLDDAKAQAMPERLAKLIAGICSGAGAEYDFDYLHGYPALVNDGPFTEQAEASAAKLLGAEAVLRLQVPEMGGEDFAFIARQVPACFFWLGVRNEERGITHSVHSSKFDIDEDALPLGVAALSAIALDYLAKGE